MKNTLIGLLLGCVLTYAGTQFIGKDETSIKDNSAQSKIEPQIKNAENLEQEADEAESKPLKIIQTVNSVSQTLSDADIENLTSDELKTLVRNYQSEITGLKDTLQTHQQAIQKLNDEREQRRNPLEAENLSDEQAASALLNIRNAIESADSEYKEVLESALSLFEDEKLITPSNDALLRHYSEEPKVQWATSAQAWLSSYLQSGVDPDINLIQLNCRATYCELYGFYGSNEPITDYRIPGAKISNYFREMASSPGYDQLFRNAENISLNTSSDNTYMSFHVFIRGVN